MLLDEEAEAKGKAYYAVGAAEHTPDHGLYAWAVDEQGSEYLPHPSSRDLATGERLRGRSESADGRLLLLARLALAVLDLARRQRAAGARSFAGRRAAARTCWSTRSRTRACSSGVGVAVGPTATS